eukprot:Gb_06758 [translate_table: standard]
MVETIGQTMVMAVVFLFVIVAVGSGSLASDSAVSRPQGSNFRVLLESANTSQPSMESKGDTDSKVSPSPVIEPIKRNDAGDHSGKIDDKEGNPEKTGENGTDVKNSKTQTDASLSSTVPIGPGNNSTTGVTGDSGNDGDHKSSDGNSEKTQSNGPEHEPEKKKHDIVPPAKPKGDVGHTDGKNGTDTSKDLEKSKGTRDSSPLKKEKDEPTPSNKTRNDVSRDTGHAEVCDEVHSCTDKKKMIACLRAPGNEMQELSLLIQNKGDDVLNVNITAPKFLKANPISLTLEKLESKTVQVVMLDQVAKTSSFSKIVIDAGHGECILDVPNQSLHFLNKQRFFEGFSYSAIITPMFGVYLLLFTVLAIGGTWMCCKFRGKRRHGDGIRYQEVEMNLPESNIPISVGGKTEAENADGWDEVWDDSWEDTEAARSSSRPFQSLSSKGLAARRSNKDGWDNAWDD